jgi:choline dehydrogenase-like flavoprotein
VTAARVDVVVIGSGAAGAALSWRLASRGASVVCLEQGDWLRPADFASGRQDFEVSLRRGRHTFNPNDRRRREDYPVTTAGAGPTQIAMWNGVGGSTVHWEGHFPRLHPSDFAVRRLDDAADDWPISYADLEPFYDLNDSMIGVSGLAGDPANPARSPRTAPPLPLGRSGEALVRGFDKLGWHWWPSDNAILSGEFDGRAGCDNGAGATSDARSRRRHPPTSRTGRRRSAPVRSSRHGHESKRSKSTMPGAPWARSTSIALALCANSRHT